MPRQLSEKFIGAFKTGILKPVLEMVRQDRELDFEIRRQEVHIYYRGGKLLGISPARPSGRYRLFFDRNYLMGESSLPTLPDIAITSEDAAMWAQNVATLKARMDAFFKCHPKTEREFQQRLVRMNGYGSDTPPLDFMVTDIEYGKTMLTPKGKKTARFDLVGLYVGADDWLGGKPRLTIFELKHGDGALKASSGIKQHLEDMLSFVKTPGALADLAQDVISHIDIKYRLGLLPPNVALGQFDAAALAERPIFVFILAEHNRNSTILRRELKDESYCSIFVNISGSTDVMYSVSEMSEHRIQAQDLMMHDELFAHVIAQLRS